MSTARVASAHTDTSVDDRHPKHHLYDAVYDPLTIAWFEELAAAAATQEILDDCPNNVRLSNLERLDAHYRDLVDIAMARLGSKADDLIRIVAKYREHVLWCGYYEPKPDASNEDLKRSLCEKLKRNISLGVTEAVICLESARKYAEDKLGLAGDELWATLGRSRQLYGSLALLHDDQEQARLEFLTGKPGYLAYPETNYAIVLDGGYDIAGSMFVVSADPGSLRLKFVTTPLHHVTLDSPTKRCPAHRFRMDEHGGLTCNDVIWDQLVRVYRTSKPTDTISSGTGEESNPSMKAANLSA